MMLIRALLAGLWIDVIEPTASPMVSKTYDFTAITPHQLRSSLDHLDRFKQIIVGGAPVDDSLRSALKGHASMIYSSYGMTETYSHVALQNLSAGETHYTAVDHVRFSTHEDALVIHAPHIGIEKLITTDCVDLISSTQFLWKGRSDHVINSGGIKLHPEQIEKALSTIISVPFFVFGKPDKRLGQSLSIVFEGHLPNEIETMVSSLDTLSKYEKPKDYFVLSQFIRSNGKILRKQTLKAINF
jgi:O-succinylbenzoic acid--CoA ligase